MHFTSLLSFLALIHAPLIWANKPENQEPGFNFTTEEGQALDSFDCVPKAGGNFIMKMTGPFSDPYRIQLRSARVLYKATGQDTEYKFDQRYRRQGDPELDYLYIPSQEEAGRRIKYWDIPNDQVILSAYRDGKSYYRINYTWGDENCLPVLPVSAPVA